MGQLTALAQKDVKAVFRDRFMVLLVFYTFALAGVARVAVARVNVDHLDLYLAPAMPMMGAMILGTLMGFALIEEREQGTWLLLRVLPVPAAKLFGYLGASASLLSFAIGLIAAWIYGYPVAHWPLFIAMLGASALGAPLVMLVLGAFATNKIEGMAMSKFVSATGILPAAIFLVSPVWQLALYWCPWYWLYVGFLRAFEHEPARLGSLEWPAFPLWLPAVATTLISILGMIPLVRAYTRRAL